VSALAWLAVAVPFALVFAAMVYDMGLAAAVAVVAVAVTVTASIVWGVATITGATP